MALKDLILVWNRLKKNIEKSTADNATLKSKLGEQTIDLVVKRTKEGFGVATGVKNKKALAPLKDGYVRQRKSLRKTGKLASDTTPNKSNFTKSGDALRNLQANITDNGTIVTPDTTKNRDKFANQDRNERQVLDLTKEEQDKLARTVAASIIKGLRSFK